MPLLVFYAQVGAEDIVREPLLIWGAILIAAGIVTWGASKGFNTLVEVRDGVRDLRAAVFGPADSREPNGLKREVKELREKLDGHIDEERDVWAGMRASLTAQHESLSRLLDRPPGRKGDTRD